MSRYQIPIPVFRDIMQTNLDAGKYTEEDRLYMVRTVATMLCAFTTKPRVIDCEIPARALIEKYPFLKRVVSKLCK